MNDKKPIYFRDFPENNSEEAIKEMLHQWSTASFIFDRHNYNNLSFEDKLEHIAALQELAVELNNDLKKVLPKA